jgi:hypothetical protein
MAKLDNKKSIFFLLIWAKIFFSILARYPGLIIEPTAGHHPQSGPRIVDKKPCLGMLPVAYSGPPGHNVRSRGPGSGAKGGNGRSLRRWGICLGCLGHGILPGSVPALVFGRHVLQPSVKGFHLPASRRSPLLGSEFSV